MKIIKIFCILALLVNICYAKDISHLKFPNLGVNPSLVADVNEQHRGLDYFIMETKVCTRCKIYKSKNEFGVDNTQKDGRHYACLDCRREYYYATKRYRLKEIPDLAGEVWRDIAGYEGWYRVSNLGRVKGVTRKVPVKYKKVNSDYQVNQRLFILKPNSLGYVQVHLSKGDTYVTHLVHRLVAKAFIENPKRLPIVNHMDCNKVNNEASNLEWVTNGQNILHAKRMGKIRQGTAHHNSKKVAQYDENWKVVKIYDSISHAARETNTLNSGISYCCRKNKGTANGYGWRYAI